MLRSPACSLASPPVAAGPGAVGLSAEAQQALAECEARWASLSVAGRAAWFADRRQAWLPQAHWQLIWFVAPVEVGTRRDVPEQVFVALGLSWSTARPTVGNLIVEQRGRVTHAPALVAGLWKFAPAFELAF